ncbi:O-antigen ligase family protein [Ekhidna sp.]|uniref:O-antigen ligase family protein n=1 Tax=Ekhidna sp. TaxID=2608089 RepID=UPI003CCBEE84
MHRYLKFFLLALITVCASWLMVQGGVKLSIVLLILPPVILFLIVAFRKPELLMHSLVAMAFLISLLSRYVPGIPFGLSIDGFLVLLILILIFDQKIKWRKEYLTNPLMIALLVWLMFSFVELFNPLAKSKIAWFYANRGLSFYPFLLTIVTMYVYKKDQHMKNFLIIWAVLSAFGTFWGMKQLFFGVSQVEQQWLNAGAASTHVLFGKLRVFSYYSDAAQFGASQAHSALVFGIIGLYDKKLKHRWLILSFALLSCYGMLISGTRGALAIPAIGGFAYLILSKKFKWVIAGTTVGVLFFCFLKFTTIGQANYQINRMRTALDSNDPSLMVRKEREKILEGYLSDKPIGGGIGSAGYWGKRFTPGTFLAELGTDGHYTRIWMETGIIGLYLYLMVLATILFYLGKLLWIMEDSLTRQTLVAFYCGLAGVCVASYTNGLLTQIPTGTLIFIGLGMIYVKAKKEKNHSVSV